MRQEGSMEVLRRAGRPTRSPSVGERHKPGHSASGKPGDYPPLSQEAPFLRRIDSSYAIVRPPSRRPSVEEASDKVNAIFKLNQKLNQDL